MQPIEKREIKLVFVCGVVDLQDHAANVFSVKRYAVSFALWIVNRAFYRLAGNYLSVIINVIVALTKFKKCAVLKGPLIVKYKLLAVIGS